MLKVDPKFITALDDWLFKNEKKYAESIKKLSGPIPPLFKQYNKPLYRGMIVDEEFLNSVNAEKMIFKDITSWTKDEKIAIGFIKDKKFITSKKSNGIKLLLTKTIPSSKIIFDIHNFVMFTAGEGLDELSVDSAYKEEEVLVDKGIKILPKEVKIVK